MDKEYQYFEGHSNPNIESETNVEIDFHETSLEKVVRWTHLPYFASWAILAVVIFAVRYLILVIDNKDDDYLYLNAFLAIELFGLACGIIWTCRKLEGLLPTMKILFLINSEDVEEWYKKKIKDIFDNKRMLYTGLVFLLIFWPLFFIYLKWESWITSKYVLYYDYAYHGLIIVIAGMSQYAFYRISGLFMGIDKLELKSNIMHHNSESITSVGKLLMRVGIMGLSLLILFAIVFYVSPLALNYANVILFLVIIFSLGTSFWFFITQLKFHKLLKNHKNKLVNNISRHIDKALSKALVDPQTKIIRQVNEFSYFLNQIRNIPEWPFNSKTTFSLLGSVLIPIILAIIQFKFK